MIAYANYFTDARIKNYVDALLKAGFEVDVFALGQPEVCPPGLRVFCLMPKLWSGNPLYYVFCQLWFFLSATFLVTRASIHRRYALVHVHNMPDFIVFPALVPKLLGAKVILDVHDTMPEAYATKFNLTLDHPLIALIRLEERVSAAFADHLIASNDLHNEVLRERGVPASKITNIMNLGNEAVFRPQPRSRAREGLTLVYHGTVAERLGLDLILDGIRQARPSCPNMRFVLIGGGDYMPTVRRLIDHFHLGDVVKTEGWVSVECLPRYLSAADLGVVGNRRYTEARRNWMLPVKMLEYAAMEIPTIAPRLKVIEYYFDDSNAVFYEPDDPQDLARCLREVYEHPEKLEAIRRGLRIFNARYNWETMRQRYMRLVNHITRGAMS